MHQCVRISQVSAQAGIGVLFYWNMSTFDWSWLFSTSLSKNWDPIIWVLSCNPLALEIYNILKIISINLFASKIGGTQMLTNIISISSSVQMAVMMSHCMLDLGSYANNNADTIEEVVSWHQMWSVSNTSATLSLWLIQELEHYIYESIPHLLPLTRLHPSMLPYYAHTAVRRFMFFLDPYRTRKVNIKKLVQSEVRLYTCMHPT